MTKKFLASLLLLVASCGCRMCSSITDHSPPLAGSPYAVGHGRAGSAFSDYESVTLPAEPDATYQDDSPELAEPPAPSAS
jgi:hypothetical protein